MNKIVLGIILVVVILVGGYYLIYSSQLSYKPTINSGLNSTNNAINTVNTNNSNPNPQNQNLTASVNIQNFSFSPSQLTIKVGTAVTWTNNDSAPHQLKSSTFNSSALSNGQTFSFTFQTPGEYSYSCAIHPSMQGRIIVTK